MKKLTRAIAIGAALGLGTLAVGQSASFASEYYPMPGSQFELNGGDVSYVSDWESSLNSDAHLFGWTSDAFDSWGGATLYEGDESWTLDQSVAPTSINTEADGTTTVVFTADTGSSLTIGTYNVTETITLQGSFAKWSVDIARADAAPIDASVDVEISGNLGADGDATFDGSDQTLISSDGGLNDPVIAWQATKVGGYWPSTTWYVSNGNDDISALSQASSNLTVIAAMVEWDPCSYDAALAYAESIKTTLVDTFGTVLDPQQSCLTVSPLSLTVGTPVTSSLTYSIPSYVTDPNGDWTFFGNGDPFALNPVTVDIQGLPAGVTFTQSQDPATGVVTIQLAGTPTETGTFAPTVTIARVHYDGDTAPLGLTGFASPLATDFTEPLWATGSITVDASLAHTGVNGEQNNTLLIVGGGVIVLGAAALIFLGVRRRNAAKNKAND